MKDKITILLLEHDENDIGLLNYELKKGGLNYLLELAQTKESYENALIHTGPDIILSDYSLPSFDGLTAFQMKQKISPATPFIIVSGAIGEGNAVELIKMGVTDYALKEKMYQIVPKIERALKESSARKQKEVAELQLRLREEQLQKIMDLSLDVICTVDEEGKFLTVGAASTYVWGYSPEELIGKRTIDLVHEDDKEKTIKATTDLRNGFDLVHFENRYIRKDGEPVTLFWSARWDSNDKLEYNVARDATEVKRAERAIKRSEKKYRSLFHSSPIPMWVYDTETFRFLDVNLAAIRHYGYNKEEFLSMTLQDIRPKQDVEELKRAVKTASAGGGFNQTVSRHIKKDGEIIYVEVQGNAIELEAYNARVVLATDISDRLNYIQAIEEQNVKLREIAWMQSHVVRAPLARMMGLISLLKDYDLEEARTTGVLDNISISAHELDGIIKEIVKRTEEIGELNKQGIPD